ncbi:ubiquitin carboxyl-terminal hydrolase 19 isoform X2 [Periophthalmus magnuspinnatus]|uniref:ubiquitin carboxyl-terminal hydrolase 19 isoform X2 n=1 Tax=Periophthalmus magnuspinnatus TaxID=409849 RepID=UPI002436F90B|nr:ubiquitin carboxyl-terminal hydrolase 19 isoform X2 [Periophthalmus magnuspinnatus]XP_055079204.1 ubiquitin carboxyl-terminal hydrolase 19 isoform X2 [Periophthalmus magnuspinnatus]
MDASAGEGGGGSGGGRAQQRGGPLDRAGPLDHSSSKKKHKDRVNQESREAKRATATERVIAEVKKDVFVDWKQNANDVIVRLRCGDGVQSADDVSSSFSDTHALVSFPDGREWSCCLQEEIEASCSRVQYKEKAGLLHLVMHKKIPFHIWPSLMSNKKKEAVQNQPNVLKKPKSTGPLEKNRVSQAKAPSPAHNQAQPNQTHNNQTQPNQTHNNQTQPNQTQQNQTHTNQTQPNQTQQNQTRSSEQKSSSKSDRKRVPQPGADSTEKTRTNSDSPGLGDNKTVSELTGSMESTESIDPTAPPLHLHLPTGWSTQTQEEHTHLPEDSSHNNTQGLEAPNQDLEMRTSPSPPGGTEQTEAVSADQQREPDREVGSEVTEDRGDCEEEKSDQCKEEPVDTLRQEAPEQMVTLQLVKNDSYEKGTDLMVVNVYIKGVCRESARVIFREQDFTLIFQTSDTNFLRLHSGCGPNTVFRWQVKLRNLIEPEQCTYSFTPSRLDIALKKRLSQRWGGLEAPTTQGAVGGAKVAVSSGPACLEKSQPGSSQHSLPPSEEPPRGGEDTPKTPKAPARGEDSGLDTVAPRSEHVSLKSEQAVTTPKPTCMVQPMSHSPAVSEAREEEEERKVCLPGFTGLVNLGNTCFMNSVIQSLSNTRELRDYFHDRAFESEINCNNPLGTGGRLAIGFAVLLRALWKGTHHAFQPSKLKAIVASKASQFTGYAQHDAQEFMAFLLDGLHEDLNRIQNKPYTETVDSDGRLDEVVAEEAWQRHKMRNDSFIVDLFQGQFKSKLVCPTCSKVSITFDPFLYLPVPLPQKQKVLSVFYFAKEPHKKPVKFLVSVSKEHSSTAEVLESISRSVRVKVENLRLAEVAKCRFQRMLLPSHSLDTVSASDMLFCFEVLSRDLAKERVVELRVHQKLQVPNIPISKCAACLKPPVSEDDKLKRCTRCYRVGYCNQVCQKTHWPNHKALCRPHTELVGLPFLISVPESRLTTSRLTQLLQGFSRFSVNVFQPPFQSGRLSPESSQCRSDLPPLSLPSEGSEDEAMGESSGEPGEPGEAEEQVECAQASALHSGDTQPLSSPSTITDSGVSELSSSASCCSDPHAEKETSCEKAVRPEAAVTGYQHSSEGLSGQSQFYISLLDSNNKEQKLEDREDSLLELSEDCTLELVWKNNERLKEYVLVSSRDLEFEEDPGSLSETSRAGHFSLEQCLNLFTRPEVLAPEEAWYCPKCQQHREASKQLLLWRLPNVLIIQLKRFSFRSFIWRDKINDMVDFPVRNLDLSKFCIGQKDDLQQPPVYDLYAVINHYGGMIGGHYTAYARLPSDKNSQRSDVGWRLFDDSTVTMVEESQVVTRYAYVLFYRRRNSPVERPPRVPRPLGAESPTAAGAAASQASSQSLFGPDLDQEGPPTLSPEMGESAAPSYSNMEEVD